MTAALAKATPDERPAVIHLGGPTPVCPALTTVHLALWMAEEALPHVTKEERAAAKAVLALVRTYLRAPTTVKMNHDVYKRLFAASTSQKQDSNALSIVRRAAGGAATLSRGKPDLVFTSTRAAAQRMITLLRETDPAAVRAFLTELDARIVRAEMVTAAQKNLKSPPPNLDLRDVLWRGPDLFVGRLADGTLAFVGKLGRSWTWVTGEANEVLGTVPDPHLEAATRAVLGHP